MITWIYNDGGRKLAGFKHCGSNTMDCVPRSIAIATGLPYREVYDALNNIAKTERPKRNGKRSNANVGVFRSTFDKYMKSLGWSWVPVMKIGTGCTMHVRADELPPGRLILSLAGHMTAVVNGVLHDTYDCSRDGMRCVYGYWHKP